MATFEIMAELNLKKIIAESREIAQALNEFADNFERIEKKYEDPEKRVRKYDEENYEMVDLGNGLYERRRK